MSVYLTRAWSMSAQSSKILLNDEDIPDIKCAQSGHGQPGMILVQAVKGIDSSSGQCQLEGCQSQRIGRHGTEKRVPLPTRPGPQAADCGRGVKPLQDAVRDGETYE